MGSNTNNYPQGNLPPTQPSPTTQYGNNYGYPPTLYAPPPPPRNKPSGILLGLLGLIVVLLVVGIIVLLVRPLGNSPSSGTTATATTQVPTATTAPPTVVATQPVVLTTPVTQPTTGSTSPIAEGDFLNSPGPITGPAIVEFWNGQGGANKVCGTFQLPSGESFSYSPAGHWWKYKSDQDMQAEWPLHVKLYTQKPENAGCTIGQRPPS